MIQFITENIHTIAAFLNLSFFLLVILNDTYDLTNEKCECGFKNEWDSNRFQTPTYLSWLKKDQEDSEDLKQEELLDELFKYNKKYYDDYLSHKEDYLSAAAVAIGSSNIKYKKHLCKSRKARILLIIMLKIILLAEKPNLAEANLFEQPEYKTWIKQQKEQGEAKGKGEN